MARLLSVNVGLPCDIEWRGRTVRTAIWKTPVEGARMVRRLNIDGDGQGDLAGHGGEHRAVFVYQIESYRYWQRYLRRSSLELGQFGENFTVEGLADDEVCIGDRYRMGNAQFEVTQPRVTCYRVGIRMDEPQMAALLVAHDRPGFYLRVIEEGEVAAGAEIVRVSAGRERMPISQINALLYKPGHAKAMLERALRIPELSTGWRTSFQALLDRAESEDKASASPGIEGMGDRARAWPGFRQVRVSRKDRESSAVTSLTLEPANGGHLAAALPGQFVLLRLKPSPSEPALLRSYSLSGEPSDAHYRVSVKRVPHGVAGTYIQTQVQAGDVLDISAPRGIFTLRAGQGPLVLLSAGVGATPVLAMLHGLVATGSAREVWWIYGARDGSEHPFAEESRKLLASLPNSRRHISYSSPRAADRLSVDFDATGRLDPGALKALNLPLEADYYLCGPAAFMRDLASALKALGVDAGRIASEIFGSEPPIAPGVVGGPLRLTHLPDGTQGNGPQVTFARSNVSVRWGDGYQSLLELAEACDVPVRWSCRTGVCHTCETAIIVGSVRYRPEPIERPESDTALICCSQPTSDIVVDL